jgi:hypothetical protein
VGVSLDLQPNEIDMLYQWSDVKNKISELEHEEEKFKGYFSEHYGKFNDGTITYQNQEIIRKGGFDVYALLKDHPEIDVRPYTKGDISFMRQQLRMRRKVEKGDVEKDTEDIV